ncbi:GntR family transcriptional regulator [Pseudomonas sp. 13B_2.1_Bac1]|uniref:GntR family transcriptional regulator n=1 Tax=Pseudomonas sp. 13B_2.1_Bac1 TaxID=2971624 RepID=UPI0021C6E004|nr:GntR family transcriptional regulator [Pseudomonas sp. 13B_2.1_Bac1]MCU1785178.1 GntR family transcriptional regulator [Pseudomonas sp. 13B_2.1_Bac1]
MSPSEETNVKTTGGPLYKQVVQKLKSDILSGTYPVGTQLPTETDLAEHFAVSRHTIRAALRQLRDDGLVSSRQGAGTTVVRPGSAQTYVHEINSISDLINYVAGMRFQIETLGMIDCSEEQAERLFCPEGQRWLYVAGFRYADDDPLPICWTEVFIHADYAGVARLLERNKSPIYELVEDVYGERVEEVEQIVQSGHAPATIAEVLQIEADTTVMEVHRRYRLTSGKVAIIALNLHKPDMFRLSFTLRRSKA